MDAIPHPLASLVAGHSNPGLLLLWRTDNVHAQMDRVLA